MEFQLKRIALIFFRCSCKTLAFCISCGSHKLQPRTGTYCDTIQTTP